MKSVKKLSIVLGAATLCGATFFSACKKDKESEAVSLAKQTCECAKQADKELSKMTSKECVSHMVKMFDHFDFTTGKFKNKDFEAEYTAYLQKNCEFAMDLPFGGEE
jgi:hypothetical protein